MRRNCQIKNLIYMEL